MAQFLVDRQTPSLENESEGRAIEEVFIINEAKGSVSRQWTT